MTLIAKIVHTIKSNIKVNVVSERTVSSVQDSWKMFSKMQAIQAAGEKGKKIDFPLRDSNPGRLGESQES